LIDSQSEMAIDKNRESKKLKNLKIARRIYLISESIEARGRLVIMKT
jgi:hypothetical protein